ncbi:MAG: hypothetical protein WC483_06080 [Candidatus Paceibacterota bacterium]
MAINTRETVNERGTIDFTVSFFDETGASVVPNEIMWTLIDDSGTVINARLDVAVETPAATVHITPTGDDTEILSDTDTLVRFLCVDWTYDSSLGSDLEGHEELQFTVKALRHVA